MEFSFDLISDLNIVHSLNWSSQPTSLLCVVAGNLAQDRSVLLESLKHLGKQYQSVFYIDGSIEHINQSDNIKDSYADLAREICNIDNVVYLEDAAVIIDGCALVGVNGWWTHDFNPHIMPIESEQFLKNAWSCNDSTIDQLFARAVTDSLYLIANIKKLQTYPEDKKIIIISNTVPNSLLLANDTVLQNSIQINLMGNSTLTSCLDQDFEDKISTWCFGGYCQAIDQMIGNIRYVSNPMGITEYYPKRITLG